jgi:hypothetical protein
LPLFRLFKVQKATKVQKEAKVEITFLSSVRLLLKVQKSQKEARKVSTEAQIKGHFRRKFGVKSEYIHRTEHTKYLHKPNTKAERRESKERRQNRHTCTDYTGGTEATRQPKSRASRHSSVG